MYFVGRVKHRGKDIVFKVGISQQSQQRPGDHILGRSASAFCKAPSLPFLESSVSMGFFGGALNLGHKMPFVSDYHSF